MGGSSARADMAACGRGTEGRLEVGLGGTGGACKRAVPRDRRSEDQAAHGHWALRTSGRGLRPLGGAVAPGQSWPGHCGRVSGRLCRLPGLSLPTRPGPWEPLAARPHVGLLPAGLEDPVGHILPCWSRGRLPGTRPALASDLLEASRVGQRTALCGAAQGRPLPEGHARWALGSDSRRALGGSRLWSPAR